MRSDVKSDARKPLLVYPSEWKTPLQLLSGAGFCALGFWFIWDGWPDYWFEIAMGAVTIAFFGFHLLALLFRIIFMFDAELRIDAHGIRWRKLGRRLIGWADIEEIEIERHYYHNGWFDTPIGSSLDIYVVSPEKFRQRRWINWRPLRRVLRSFDKLERHGKLEIWLAGLDTSPEDLMRSIASFSEGRFGEASENQTAATNL